VIVGALLAGFRPNPHIDLYPTYVAARLANEGAWDRIYHASAWLHGGVDPAWDASARAYGVDPEQGTAFVYHPWYLSLARPLAARLDYPGFQQLSVWINGASVVLVGLGMALLLGWRGFSGQLLATLVVALASPTPSGIDLGQNVLPALACSLGAALAWRERAPLWLGVLAAALAWTCKPWCALLLPLCFLLRGARAGLLSGAALAGLMVVLPELVMPRVLMRDYAALNLSLMRSSVPGWNNLSLLSTFERATQPDWSLHLLEWIPREPSATLRAAAFGVSAAVFGSALWIRWRRRPAATWTAAAWLALMLMPLGICWTHYFLFALPLACLAASSGHSSPALRGAALALLAMVLAMATLFDVLRDELAGYALRPLGFPWLYSVPMLLLAGVALGALWCAPGEPNAPA
jgi:Glycosyltransferase family 87